MHISLNFSVQYLHMVSFILTSVCKHGKFCNKYEISLEPAKHINDRVVMLLDQTVEARQINIENKTRRLKIKSIGMIVSQNDPITDYHKFLHDKNNQSDNNYNFLHGKNKQSNHNYRFLHVSHPCNYGLIAFLAINQNSSNFAQHVIII